MPFQPRIFNWFFSFLLLISISVSAQQVNVGSEEDRLKESKDPIKKGKTKKEKVFFERDLKFGWDVSNILLGAISSNTKGLDFSLDCTIKKDFYGTVEVGKTSYTSISDEMEYFSEGKYFRVGFDSDRRKNKKDLSRDIFYLGARYAFATFTQRLNNYQLNSNYWPSVTEDEVSVTNKAHWVEALTGFKVEVMKNMYLGLGLRIKLMIFQSGDKTIKPAPYIPGYGKTSGSIIMGFNYSMYYNLPLNYSKKISNRAQ